MKIVHLFAIIAISSSICVSESLASGVGLRQYQPAKMVTPVSYACPTGQCQSGARCSGCKLKGFACVDGATPSPCTADGGCTPNRATFGFNKTRWRRWPGDADTTGPTPADATAGDSLLTPFDTPSPEDEDQQAPPPIEDDPGVEEGDESPLLEIDLPPLPEHRFDVPAAPAEDEPPALPFGSAPTRSSMPNMAEDRSLPELPAFEEQPKRSRGFRALPASLPSKSPSKRRDTNAPPALPEGFTQLDAGRTLASLRRLPKMTLRMPSPRVDTAVRPVAAIEPILLWPTR